MHFRPSNAPRSLLAALVASVLAVPAVAAASPSPQEYRSSVVGTEFDFIVDEDPSVFLCLEFKGVRAREMPDKTRDARLIQRAYVFVAYFEDGTEVDVAIADEIGTQEDAQAEAMRYAPRLGKLPSALRQGVRRLVVHAGRVDATAFSDAGLIVVYSGNATRRIATHDLEETLFHESVHAAWDKAHAGSAEWIAAQEADGVFITDYARSKPKGEDLAESALFAYGLLHHPERIPAAQAASIEDAIPARIAFVAALLPPDEPIFHRVGPRYAADGSGTTFTIDGVNVEDLEGPDSLGGPESLDAEGGEAEGGEAEDAEADGSGDPGDSRGSDGPVSQCTIDLGRVGGLSDVLSNALIRGFRRDEPRVQAFLREARQRVTTAEELRQAAAEHFALDRPLLDRMIEDFRHCNCDHDEDPPPRVQPPGERVDDGPSPASAAQPSSDSASPPTNAAMLPSSARGEGEGQRPLLLAIAGLLALLLMVNSGTLLVLVKRSRSAS